MKHYRDMNAAERAVADVEHARQLQSMKLDAEGEMEWFDSLDPDLRELARNDEWF